MNCFFRRPLVKMTRLLCQIRERMRPTALYRFLHRFKRRSVQLWRDLAVIETRFIWRCSEFFRYRRLLRARQKMVRPLVSVIIPTYRPNDYIADCVDSVLSQDRSLADIEILICVNGVDKQYFEELQMKYGHEKSIRILYTEKKGAGTARNLGVRNANGSFISFVDDDDFLTRRFISEMMTYVQEDTEVVCGRHVDLDINTGKKNSRTYINKALGRGICTEETRYNPSLFTFMTGSLYSKEFLRRCTDIDETLTNTEDVVFWVENIGNIQGAVAGVRAVSSEAYIRRVTPDSRSRPDQHAAFSFYVNDRIRIIERITAEMFHELPLWQNSFLLAHIKTQYLLLLNYYNSLPEESEYRQKVREAAKASASPFINLSKMGEVKGIAFCHNFSPHVDASAYVSTKRLAEISGLYGKSIDWTVFAARMQSKEKDFIFHTFYAEFQFSELNFIGETTFVDEKTQQNWGIAAFEQAQSIKADVMYSRSMWPGSHVAALAYRRAHPGIKWYAEFSDPLYMDEYDKVRPVSTLKNKNFHMELEYDVMSMADVIIFTNPNQRTYMLENNPLISDREKLLKKSVVMIHPALPERFVSLIRCESTLNPDFINIGYFGTFYVNRKQDDMAFLLRRPDVAIHIFTPIEFHSTSEALQHYGERLQIHDVVDYMSFLNLASRFDYLFLSDIATPSAINPYLPSKYADYRVTGTPILARVCGRSILSELNDPRLIRFEIGNESFLDSLHKKAQYF